MRSRPDGTCGTREGPRVAVRSRASPLSATAPRRTPVPDSAIVLLGGEQAAASAAASRVRILESEARTHHRCHVVDGHAVQILRRERIDEHAPTALVDHEVVFRRLVLDEQPILEAAAPARLHAHAESTLRWVDAFLLHELLHLG